MAANPSKSSPPSQVSVVPTAGVRTELVFGLVGAKGTDWEDVTRRLTDALQLYGYDAEPIDLSEQIQALVGKRAPKEDAAERARLLMDWGDSLRDRHGHEVLARAAAVTIKARRPEAPGAKPRAYIVRSLKHPAEVAELRAIYPRGFYLFGVHTAESRCMSSMTRKYGGMDPKLAKSLLDRDQHDRIRHGQHTADAFELSDFFLVDKGDSEFLENDIDRCLELIFGRPDRTPTFKEYAMFLAFCASLRSGDMARQVGAVITRDEEVLAIEGNDCPRFGGGLYFPEIREKKIVDVDYGRDLVRGEDSNVKEREKVVLSICESLGVPEGHEKFKEYSERIRGSKLREIMEFTRSVHAEMGAILSCARSHVSTVGATLYCTTFPCHNCARHIIAAGIRKVVYVEPYEKSKAIELHGDAIAGSTTDIDTEDDGDKVLLRPFIGVGARQFFNLFSMSLSSGVRIERKYRDGRPTHGDWHRAKVSPRVPMHKGSHISAEAGFVAFLEEVKVKEQSRKGGD